MESEGCIDCILLVSCIDGRCGMLMLLVLVNGEGRSLSGGGGGIRVLSKAAENPGE